MVAESGRHERLREVRLVAHPDRLTVAGGAGAPCGGELVAEGRVDEHAGGGRSVDLRSDGDRIAGEAVYEVRGGVDRVDDPANPTGPGQRGLLLAEDPVVGPGIEQPGDNLQL